MASDDVAQLADVLSKIHVGDGELGFRGSGLKLDDAESGEMSRDGSGSVFSFNPLGQT